jgi:hypothetical protein
MRGAASRRVVLPALLTAVVAFASAAFMSAAYAAIGVRSAACLVLLPAVLVPFHGRTRRAWAAPAFLSVMVAAAAAAAALGASAFLVVPGAALALAAWDLADFDRFLRAGESSNDDTRPRRRHAASLARALALGLLPAAGAIGLSLRIPFGVMLLLVILDLGCLGYAVHLLWKQGRSVCPGDDSNI